MKVKVYPDGYLPTRAHADDAGLDFRTPVDFKILAWQHVTIDTKVAIQIPVGCYGRVESKSGIMTNMEVCVMGGIIDSSYRGTIRICLLNCCDYPRYFKKGDKIAQLLIVPCIAEDIVQVDQLDEGLTDRGTGGFGSTGK